MLDRVHRHCQLHSTQLLSVPALLAFWAICQIALAGTQPDNQSTTEKQNAAQNAPPATQPAATPQRQPEKSLSTEETRRQARANLVSGLIGSKHDFTREGDNGRNLCLPCHTPHLIRPPEPELDQRDSIANPLQPYRAPGVELTGWSLLCLGCHDGVTAQDVYASGHAVSVADQIGISRLGTVGLRSHPVGVKYPAASNEDYLPAATVEAAGLLLPDGRIQCTTCHDAHNTHGYVGMLRISNQRSRLCLTCHRR